jgi:selenium metabolism protein YedF
LAEGGFGLLEVIVDNAAARENVLRYAAYASCNVETVKEEGGSAHIYIRPAAPGSSLPETIDDEACVETEASTIKTSVAGATTILISADRIGRGDDELGALLMRGFLYALTETAEPPRRLVFLNSGVRLVVEGSESLANLARLIELGVEILACGTCLEFLQLKEKLAVGRITNMYEIAEFLLEGRSVSL